MVWMPSVPGEGLPNPGLSSAGDLRSEGGGGGMSRHLTALLWRQQHWNQAACLKYFLLPFINTQHMAVHLRIQASELYTVLVVNVCHKKTKTTNELIWLCSVCATVAHIMFFYTQVPVMSKNTSVKHTITAIFLVSVPQKSSLQIRNFKLILRCGPHTSYF